MQVICSYETYDRLEEIFEKMTFKAGEYVPTMDELKNEVEPNIQEYIKFLLWVDITGTKSEENGAERKEIRKLLREYLVMTEDAEELEADL